MFSFININWFQLQDYLEKIKNINVPINMYYFNTYAIIYIVLFIIIALLFIESIILKNKAISKIQKAIQDEEQGKTVSENKIKSIRRTIFYFYVISNIALFMGIALGLKAYFQFKNINKKKIESKEEKCFRAKMLYNKITGQCYVPKTIDYLKVYRKKLSEDYETIKKDFQRIDTRLYNIRIKIKKYKEYIKAHKNTNNDNVKQLVEMKKATLPSLIETEKLLVKKWKYLKNEKDELARKLNITDSYMTVYQDMETIKDLDTDIKENKKLNDFINDGLNFIKKQSVEDTIKFKAEMKAKNDLEKIKNQ